MYDRYALPRKTIDVQLRIDSMTSTQTGKESAVSAAVEALRKAMVAGDKSALEKLATAELSYGHSSGRLENRLQQQEQWKLLARQAAKL